LRSVGSANCDMVMWQAVGYYKSLRTEGLGQAGVGGGDRREIEKGRAEDETRRVEQWDHNLVTWQSMVYHKKLEDGGIRVSRGNKGEIAKERELRCEARRVE